jgi:hypothetical protein
LWGGDRDDTARKCSTTKKNHQVENERAHARDEDKEGKEGKAEREDKGKKEKGERESFKLLLFRKGGGKETRLG